MGARPENRSGVRTGKWGRRLLGSGNMRLLEPGNEGEAVETAKWGEAVGTEKWGEDVVIG